MSTYSDLVNVEEFGEKKLYFNEDRGDISFYCKDCKKIISPDRKDPKGYVFICKICENKNISIGTLQGLKDRYKI